MRRGADLLAGPLRDLQQIAGRRPHDGQFFRPGRLAGTGERKCDWSEPDMATTRDSRRTPRRSGRDRYFGLSPASLTVSASQPEGVRT
jgi:hypothetical protein